MMDYSMQRHSQTSRAHLRFKVILFKLVIGREIEMHGHGH